MGKQNKFKATTNLNVSFNDVHIESTENSFSENDELPPLPQVGPKAHNNNNNNFKPRPGWVPSVGPTPNVYLHPPIRSTE